MEELQPSLLDASVPMMGLSLSRNGVASGSTLKRAAPSSFEGPEAQTSKKRFKEDLEDEPDDEKPVAKLNYEALAEDLTQELQCGCCAELVYRPVVVSPCQHFFCGRYDSFRAWSYVNADVFQAVASCGFV
jgi:E3 ubiquitin-protein ligase CHFR